MGDGLGREGQWQVDSWGESSQGQGPRPGSSPKQLYTLQGPLPALGAEPGGSLVEGNVCYAQKEDRAALGEQRPTSALLSPPALSSTG